jgi:hypothetical protein
MAGLFRSNRTNNQDPVASALRVSASVQGTPIPIGCGQTRWPPILIDYAGFSATPAKSSGSKGGVIGSSGKGNTGQYTYACSAISLLGEGVVEQICTIYNGNNVDFLVAPSAQTLADLNAIGIPSSDITTGNATYNTIFHQGNYTDTADSWWAANFPTHALAHRGLSYVVWPNLQLGSSPSFPSFTVEAQWSISSDIAALGPDANPADWIQAFLTNADWGVQGFPPSAIGDFATARNYWRATGMLISLSLCSPVAANSHLKSLMEALNCEFRQSGAVFDIVPYGDVAVTGNGYTYTPNTTPVYSLGPNDFLPNQGSLGQGGMTGKSFLVFSAANPLDVFNKIQVKYLDRANLYNPVTIYWTDDASITAQGRIRLSDLKDNSFFNLASAATMSITLQGQRLQAQMRQWQCTVGRQFVLLDVMDLVTLTEPTFGLVNQLMRITEIDENADSTLTLTMEEVPLTASAPVYNTQSSLGAGRLNNAPPGAVNPPYFFEPPVQLTGGGLQLVIGLSGSVPANFGGCDVYYSTDSETYSLLGRFEGSTRMGVLTAPLPSVSSAVNPPTIDAADTLAVNLSESAAELTSVSPASFAANATISVVDQEVVAYQTATLLAGNTYDLTTLSRGIYGSAIAAHAAGALFMRLDGSQYLWDYPADLIGQTIYFKFCAFNQFGVATQNLADVGAYPYTLQGSALSAPLAAPTQLFTNFANGFEQIWFTEITDPRAPIFYELRRGSTAMNAAVIATQAHAPFTAPGAGTYWVAAKVTPIAGLTIYSAWQSIVISANQLQQNTLTTYDDQAAGWAGTIGSGLGVAGTGSGKYLRLAGSGNILAANPFLVGSTAAAAAPSGDVISVIPAGPIAVGMVAGDETTPGAIPAGATVVSVSLVTLDLGSVAAASTATWDLGSVALSATTTLDLGHVADAISVTLSVAVTGGGVLMGDNVAFSIADVLSYGGVPVGTPSYYQSAETVNAGYLAQFSINASLAYAGVPSTANILADANVLTDQDVLDSASTALVSAWIEISLSQDGVNFGAFQRFMVGVFSCWAYRLRVGMLSNDPGTIAELLAFNQAAQLPTRIDHYTGLSVPAAGLTIVFQPDYATTPGAFNAGPAGAVLPYPIVAPQTLQAGDTPVISGETLSQLTLKIMNGGVAVARTGVSLTVEGF